MLSRTNVNVRRLSAEIVRAQVDDHDVWSPLRRVPSRVGVVGHSALVNCWERYWTRWCLFTVVAHDTCHVSRFVKFRMQGRTFARPALNVILGTQHISSQCRVIDFNVLCALIEGAGCVTGQISQPLHLNHDLRSMPRSPYPHVIESPMNSILLTMGLSRLVLVGNNVKPDGFGESKLNPVNKTTPNKASFRLTYIGGGNNI